MGLRKPVLILGYTFPEHYEQLVSAQIRPAVWKLSHAQALSEAAVRLNRTLPIHLAVDSGMTRIGFPDREESVALIREIKALPGLEIEGMFTHFARADEADTAPPRDSCSDTLIFWRYFPGRASQFRSATAVTVPVSSVFPRQIWMWCGPALRFTGSIRRMR